MSKLTVFIIGLGMIGASLAAALKLRSTVLTVTAYTRTQEHLTFAEQNGIIDQGFTDLEFGARAADIIVLCTPIGAYASIFKKLKPILLPHQILTDVGSAKACVVSAAESVFDQLPAGFVPGHPIAGSEKSGVAAANPELFVRHKVILTPLASTEDGAVRVVSDMWSAVGAELSMMSVVEHDRILAATSHLPHLLAFSLVASLTGHQSSAPDIAQEKHAIFQYAAGGFRDFTRIAASDPKMWVDIFTLNKSAILATAKQFSSDLDNILALISVADQEPEAMMTLMQILVDAKSSRDEF